MITDPQIKRFCNERVRLAADRLARLYNLCRTVRDEWTAQDMGTAIPDTAELVDDGAAVDGRPEISGADVHAIKDRVVELIALLEANGNAKLDEVLRVAVNTRATDN